MFCCVKRSLVEVHVFFCLGTNLFKCSNQFQFLHLFPRMAVEIPIRWSQPCRKSYCAQQTEVSDDIWNGGDVIINQRKLKTFWNRQCDLSTNWGLAAAFREKLHRNWKEKSPLHRVENSEINRESLKQSQPSCSCKSQNIDLLSIYCYRCGYEDDSPWEIKLLLSTVSQKRQKKQTSTQT